MNIFKRKKSLKEQNLEETIQLQKDRNIILHQEIHSLEKDRDLQLEIIIELQKDKETLQKELLVATELLSKAHSPRWKRTREHILNQT